VEPWLDVVAEVTGEWLHGTWAGVSQPIVCDMRWEGQWLGEEPTAGGMSREVADFVYVERAVERALAGRLLIISTRPTLCSDEPSKSVLVCIVC